MQYYTLPLMFGWFSPVWWDFLPALQDVQEPAFLQQPQHSYEKSVFETNILLQTLETLAGEDSRKQLLLTFILIFVTFVILMLCLVRWRQIQRSIRFRHFEKPREMVMIADDSMVNDSFDIVDSAQSEEWKYESINNYILQPSEQPLVSTPKYLHPRKDLLNIFNTAEGMTEPVDLTRADFLAKHNHSPEMKRTTSLPESKNLNETPKKQQYLRKSKVFSEFCTFMNQGIYTLPARLGHSLSSVFSIKKVQEEEGEGHRPRYVKAWYAAEKIPDNKITDSFADMNR